MKLIKQPWFLILILAGAIYSYQFYQSPKRIKVRANQAEATSLADKKEGTEEVKTLVSVKTSQEFPAKRSLNFELSTDFNMNVKFAKTDGNQVIVSLIGEGDTYKNNGQRLADWFQVSSAGKTLNIQSFNKKNSYEGFSSLKKLAKTLTEKRSEEDFTMIVEVPENFEFETVKIAAVTSDVFASDLKFQSFKMAAVSGNLRLKSSLGKTLKVESVSGNSNVEISELEAAEFASVSGSVTLKSDTTNPTVEFESVSGDFNLIIPKDSQVDVSFESMTGELINAFGISNEVGKKMKFSSLSGSAKISKL